MGENKYEGLKLPQSYPDAPDLLADKEVPLSKHPAETVTILLAVQCGRWAWGYRVCWANGRSSYRNPTFALGIFRSEHDALMYGIGYMEGYAPYFQPETVINIKAAESRHSATSLPLFDEP